MIIEFIKNWEVFKIDSAGKRVLFDILRHVETGEARTHETYLAVFTTASEQKISVYGLDEYHLSYVYRVEEKQQREFEEWAKQMERKADQKLKEIGQGLIHGCYNPMDILRQCFR